MRGTGAKLIGAKDITQNLRQYQTRIESETKKGLAKVALRVQRNAKENLTKSGAVYMGRLRSSIKVHPTENGKIQEVYTNVNYAAAVEFGSKPYFPPVEQLSDWSRKKIGIDLGFVIARKIAREGTQAKPYLFPALEKERPGITKELGASIRGVFR